MYRNSNGSLRLGGLVLGGGLAVTLFASFSAVLGGCPGPAPQDGTGGSGGRTSTSSTSSTSTSSTSSTSTSSTSSTSTSSTSSTSTSSTSSTSTSSTTSSGAVCALPDTCIPAAPNGWDGPYLILIGAPGSAPPACPTDATPYLDGGFDASAPAAECSCYCLPPTGVDCTVTATVSTDSACKANLCGQGTLTQGACTVVPSLGCGIMTGGELFYSVTSTPDGGACMPVPGKLPPPEWAPSVACTLPTPASCTGGSETCVPALPTPDAGAHAADAGGGGQPASRYCIASQTQNGSCPSGSYSVPMMLGTAIDDGRTCDMCGCGPVDGGTCSGGSASVVAGQGCNPNAPVSLPHDCSDLSGSATNLTTIWGELVTAPTADGGACAPSPPTKPNGTVTADGVWMLCCM